MTITEQDFDGIKTYGYSYSIDEYGCAIIDMPHAIITLIKRPCLL